MSSVVGKQERGKMGKTENQSNKLASKAIAMFAIMIISKVLGFSRDILLAYKFGTSSIVDAYTVAITLPSVLFSVFVSGLNQSYIPFYTRMESSKRKQEFFSNTLIIYAVVSVTVVIIGFLSRDLLASLLAPGFDSTRHDLCLSFIGIIIWMFPFYMIFALMSAQLQTREDFNMSNICDFIVVNVVVILSILTASPDEPSILAIGYALSMVIASFILTIYFLMNGDTSFAPRRENAMHEFKDLMIIAIPVGLSFMVNQLNSVTDSVFSSTFSSGVTSGLNYANKIQSIFLTLTTTVFMTVVFPRLNAYFAQRRYVDGLYYIKKGLLVSSWLSIPFAAFVGVFARDIIIAMFQRGAFDETSTAITTSCLVFYSVGIPFYSYVEIGSRTLTASLKQKLILKDTTIAVAFNILADYVLMKSIGYIGLSLATSISGVLLFALYFIDIRRNDLICFNKEIVLEIIKIVVATIISIFVSVLVNTNLLVSLKPLIGVLFTASIFGGIYLVLCIILKVSILGWLINRLGIKVN